jgi:hypothetical protein
MHGMDVRFADQALGQEHGLQISLRDMSSVSPAHHTNFLYFESPSSKNPDQAIDAATKRTVADIYPLPFTHFGHCAKQEKSSWEVIVIENIIFAGY